MHGQPLDTGLYYTLVSIPLVSAPMHRNPRHPGNQNHIHWHVLWRVLQGSGSCKMNPVPHRQRQFLISPLLFVCPLLIPVRTDLNIYHYENNHPGQVQRLHDLHCHRRLPRA